MCEKFNKFRLNFYIILCSRWSWSHSFRNMSQESLIFYQFSLSGTVRCLIMENDVRINFTGVWNYLLLHQRWFTMTLVSENSHVLGTHAVAQPRNCNIYTSNISKASGSQWWEPVPPSHIFLENSYWHWYIYTIISFLSDIYLSDMENVQEPRCGNLLTTYFFKQYSATVQYVF
jgi:hypothetical protein